MRSGIHRCNRRHWTNRTNGNWIGWIACWDLNGDGIQDPNEDINGDGSFDALDCQGSDHDWYKANTTDQQATSISNNIYTNGRVGIAEINPQGQLQISKNVNGGSNGTQPPSLLIDQDVDHWMGGTLTTNAIKIDIDADGVELRNKYY